jgi:hypothetical protein
MEIHFFNRKLRIRLIGYLIKQNRNDLLVVCSRCYITGNLVATLTLDQGFNVSQSILNITNQTVNQIDSLTTIAINSTLNAINNDAAAMETGDLDELTFPTIPANFSLDLGSISQAHLGFIFNGVDMYFKLNTQLSPNTYTFNIYTSDTPIGFSIDGGINVGVVVMVDLILDINTQINMESGFHFTLKDGFGFNLDLLSKNISQITMNGGQFEFLPVSIVASGATFKAVLRLGLHAGIELQSTALNLLGHSLGSYSTGLEAAIFTDLAEFTTSISDGNGTSCEFEVEQEYQLAIGAEAGATVALDGHIWGPIPETSTPIWGTTLAKTCGISSATATSSTTSTTITSIANSMNIFKRQASGTTTTVTTTGTYTAIQCQSSGVINCPISLQSTIQYTSVSSYVTTATSGQSIQSAQVTQTTVNTIPFGVNAQPMTSTTGAPATFTPPPSNNKPVNKLRLGLIVGLVVSFGVLLLIGILVLSAMYVLS